MKMVKRVVGLMLSLVLALAPRAHATEKPAGDLEFNLFDGDPHQTPAEKARAEEHTRELERMVKRRRTLLKWHQGLGFAALGLLAAELVLGQLNYQDKFSSQGEYSRRYNDAHLAVGVGASTVFAVTASLALAAPNPYPKPIKLDAALLHKVSMAMAAACFVTQLVLGPISVHKEGTTEQRPLALAHLVVGYGSFAFMATGTVAYLVK